jgi:hypothetical protein
MKKYALLLSLIAVIVALETTAQGIYRWDVKLLIDTAGHRFYKMKA